MEKFFNNNNISVIVKPAGIPSLPDKTGDPDAMSILSGEINSELFPVHRLDRPVGGILVFAKNKKTAGELSEQLANSKTDKKYLAVVCGRPDSEEGELTDYILTDKRKNVSRVVHQNTRGSKEARFTFKLLEYNNEKDISLLLIGLKTGRHHQIRVQLSNFGLPIWGDRKYNNRAFPKNAMPALWSFSITVPVEKGVNKTFTATPSDYPFSKFKKISENF